MVNREARALDDVQEEVFSATPLRGDRWVDENATLPVTDLVLDEGGPRSIGAVVEELLLDGEWLVNSCKPDVPVREIPLKDWIDVVINGTAGPGLRSRWHLPSTDRSDWFLLRVPGSIQSSMIEKGLLDDPYWNTNTYDELVQYGTPTDTTWNMRKTRIEQKEWWYAKTFTLPEDLKGIPLALEFDGIDYSATVYLNGHSLGLSTGMFGGPEYDVRGVVNPEGENTLVVRVSPPPQNWFGVLKGNPGWGWHYGHLISVGIWKSVRLRATPEVEAENLFVSTPQVAPERSTIRVQFDVRNAGTQSIPLRAHVNLTLPDGTTSHYRAALQAQAGTSRWSADIQVANAQLWWPVGWGEQALHSISLTLADEGGIAQGPQLDARFGIRSIEMAQHNRPASESDYRWQFVINGVPLFIKGANWCWTDPTNGPDSSCRAFLEHVVDARIQMLRAWGGGIIESTEFYDFCDEAGILVYQEFPYSWGPPDAPGTDLAVLDDQVRRVVLSRRNHPSLIMWGGGNENAASAGADEGLTLVGKRCRQFDPSRPFHRTDPWGGSAHNYEVYHWGRAIDEGYLSVDSVFYGEYGLPSMPNRRSCERMLPPEALASWPPTAEDHGVISHMHQFQLYDFVKGLRFAHYGPVRDWDQYIEYSQMAQGDALRFASERQRAGAVDGSKTGFWFYKLTELFPGHSWGILDFWGVRKDSFYRAKQVLRPRALFATYDKFDWAAGETFSATVFAANDTATDWQPGKIVAELYDHSLELLARVPIEGPTLLANSTVRLGEVTAQIRPGSTPSLLSVRRADEDVEFDSWYWFNFLSKSARMREIEASPFPADGALPTDLESEALIAPYTLDGPAPLLELPLAKLSIEVRERAIVITNVGEVPAFNIHVRGRTRDVRVSDSGFCLGAGASRVVDIEDGQGDDAVVSAWNIHEARQLDHGR